MWYFGVVTPKGFIDRLSRQLDGNTSLPAHRLILSKKCDRARLVIPVPGQLNSLIQVTVETVGSGNGMLIEMNFVEVDSSGSERATKPNEGSAWYRVIIRQNEHRSLRNTCSERTSMITSHIKDIEYMQISDFIN